MIAAAGPSALWYLTRGSGAVTLLLLTASVVLGIAHVRRARPAGSPRLVVESAHRTLSLLVLVVLAVHVATAVLDPFAPIRLVDAVVPFTSAYRPLWLGFGALALDLLVALAVTSLLRARLGFRAWRAVHWLAYACWPVAVVHGLGTGSDARTTWLLVLTLGCVAAVLLAAGVRLASSGPGHRVARGGGAAALVAALIALAVWLPQGPLAPGWARRSGTPASLLASARPATPRPVAATPATRPFSVAVHGAEHDGLASSGLAVVDLALKLPRNGERLRVRLGGLPLENGGVQLSRSAVTLHRRGTVWTGRIAQLNGNVVRADVGAADGRAMRLQLNLDLSGPVVKGRLSGHPLTAGANG